MGKTAALRGNIVSFQQQKTETISEAWERFKDTYQIGTSPWNDHMVTYVDLLQWINPKGS